MKIRDRIVELRRVRARDLVPHPRNWRTHPKRQQEALRGILAEVGYADALLARETEQGLMLIDGHLRAETTPDQEVPVLVLDVTEDEADKLLASIDPLSAMAGQDDEILRELLTELETESDPLRALFDELCPPEPRTGLIDPDAIPEPPDEPITKPGDLWVLGDHRLLCGDSSKTEDLDRLLDGQPVHLVNTDPPYNVKVEPRSNNAIAAAGAERSCHQGFDTARRPGAAKATGPMRPRDRALENDFVSDAEFDRLLRAWFGNLSRVLLAGRAFYIWGGYSNVSNYPPAIAEADLYLSQVLVWVKEHPVMTRKDFMGNHESAFYGWKKGSAHFFSQVPSQVNLSQSMSPRNWRLRQNAPTGLAQSPVVGAIPQPVRQRARLTRCRLSRLRQVHLTRYRSFSALASRSREGRATASSRGPVDRRGSCAPCSISAWSSRLGRESCASPCASTPRRALPNAKRPRKSLSARFAVGDPGEIGNDQGSSDGLDLKGATSRTRYTGDIRCEFA